MNRNLWRADYIRFRIQGSSPQRYVNSVTAQGLQLSHIRWEKDGLVAQGFGRDYNTLRDAAIQGGWQFSVVRRHGPGRILERAVARPGIVAGGILFLVLLNFLHRFVWTIDFGTLDGTATRRMRTLLAECGICEGMLLQNDTLADAQTLALQQSDLFGWVSLNFTGGCLFIENTEAQEQTIREEAPMKPLYAKAAGVITAVEAESGFACTTPGQTVEAGQLLVDIVRLDRDGREIRQGASGKIMAQCEQTFTASEALQETVPLLKTSAVSRDTLHLLGGSWELQADDIPAEEPAVVEWLPLRLGRLSLPGCICRKIVWTQEEQVLQRSEEQAAALAQRSCRQQLFTAFPDAEILSESRVVHTDSDAVTAEITYRFEANIAFSQE